jgi:hypothetical protein
MRKLLLIALLACAGSRLGYAQVESHSDVQSTMVALENLWNQAVEAQDLNALNRILDDGFVQVDWDGRILTKAGVLAGVKASHGFQLTSKSMVVHLHGDTAVVTGIYQMMGVERGKRLVRLQRFVDTWQFKDGLWMSIARLATPFGS